MCTQSCLQLPRALHKPSLSIAPCSQILREDFSYLGVHPSVAAVAAADLRMAGDHRAWDVSWDSTPGNAMESADFSCAAGANITADYTGEGTCTTALVAASAGGSALSGKFALTVSSIASGFPTSADLDPTDESSWGAGAAETTAFLEYNATAENVRVALEALAGVAAAEVELVDSLPGGDRSGGSTYLVTFPGASGATSPAGGMSLTASAVGLNGTGAEATVREVFRGSRWGGEFALSMGGLDGPAVPFDARAEEMQEAISALVVSANGDGGEGGGIVEVWREELEAGFRWAVAFSGGSLDGDIELMSVSYGTGMKGIWMYFSRWCVSCAWCMLRFVLET